MVQGCGKRQQRNEAIEVPAQIIIFFGLNFCPLQTIFSI